MSKKQIKKHIFLENLPRHTDGRYMNKINWEKSKGYKVQGIYDNINFEVEIIKYITKGQKLIIKYNNNESELTTGNFIKCGMGRILGRITKDFKIEIGTHYKDDKRDIIIIDRKYRIETRADSRGSEKNHKINFKWYKYHCNICGYEGWIEESVLARGIGCSVCSGQTLIQGINDIPTTAPFMVKYFQGGYDEAKLYTKWGSGNPNNPKGYIYPICPDCKEIRNKKISIGSIYNNNSIACHCGDGQSYPNKFAFQILTQSNVDFIPEYSPEWINPKSYDFYFKLNDKEYILEMDGGFHNKDNNMNGQTKEQSKAIDNYKDKLALENNIEVIRIDCKESNLEYIKQNILKSTLNELFDLSSIDWFKVEEFALSNRVKEACDLWNKGIHRTYEIGEIMKIKAQTVCRYLKKGKLLAWCDYDPQQVVRKKTKRPKMKSIEVFKNNISFGVFKSGREIERKSKELFGTNLLRESIYKVCNNKIIQYKGFLFKYV